MRNYVEGPLVRRKHCWKAGGGVTRLRAWLGRRTKYRIFWKRTGGENDKVEYKTAKGEGKSVVARMKAEKVGMYDKLGTVERYYRIAAARDLSGNGICQKCNSRRLFMKDDCNKER